MDLLAIDTCVPAVTARGAIVEKGQKRCKAIGDYLNNHFDWKAEHLQEPPAATPAEECQDFLAVPAALTPRWRSASNRQTPVATDTLRLLTLPAIGRRTK